MSRELVTLSWVGDVDLGRVEELRAQLTQALAGNPAQLIIDLSEVAFIDSMGVGLLLEARVAAIRADTRLVLRDMTTRTRSILLATGTLKLFNREVTDAPTQPA
ncbi:STAS domain-containing protein [uncultured Jatrophihabitans sp.]|uniref:STAS domain-containing protein n=1 Tax=uncultured Jatrophihabitans sp. TaxID=1610747 RepID=UPI0035CADDE9